MDGLIRVFLQIGMAYSAVFEYVLVTKLPEERIETDGILAVNVALHFCLHVTGIHTFITKEVRQSCQCLGTVSSAIFSCL